MTDVVVVGGGVVGLASAWALARQGLRVTVVEPGPLGGQSSQAAAGILGPLAESSADGPLTRLLWASLERFPTWVAALAEDSAADPEFETRGVLRLVAPAQAAAERASMAWRTRYDPAVTWVEPGGAPPVPEGWAAAIWSPHEGQIHGPRYLDALLQAAVRRGVNLEVGTLVTALEREGDRVVGVRTDHGRIPAAAVVLAAGAWSAPLAATVERRLDVAPVRGQVLGVRAPVRPFDYVLFAPGAYVAPKADGLLVLGATEDHSGYDSRVTLDGLYTVARRIAAIAPDLLRLPFDRAWSGLRPGTADGLPYLGRWPDLEGLVVATGHYRNGILLSPLTADVVTALVTGSTPPPSYDPAAFGPARSARTPGSPDEAAR
ncbi:MAG: glycine oxidase ThiO [Actinomycetia bacterium]|nr:glycine oxidase ThiO [Actinomycetes bacterium]